jgi:hypothetical protein
MGLSQVTRDDLTPKDLSLVCDLETSKPLKSRPFL